MTKPRPRNLNLLTISFPAPAIASILHRISGVVLFISIPMMLWALSQSLRSEADFKQLQDQLTNPLWKVVLLLVLAPFIYHFVAGIRHLLMDLSLGIELKSAKFSAILAILVAAILFILVGYYLW